MGAVPSSLAVCLVLVAACATGRRPPPPPEQPRPSPPSAAPAGANPFLPEVRSLFAGCVGRAQGRGRAYSCGDVEAWIVDLGAVEPGVAMRIGTSGLRAMIGEIPEAQKTELTLAGRRWPAVRVSVCNDASPPRCDSGHVVAVAAPHGGGSWFLGCTAVGGSAGGLARCEKVLDSFAQKGTPEGLPLARPESGPGGPPRLLSRALVVPGGCQLVEASALTGNIECRDSSFGWIVSSAQVPGEMEADFERFLVELQRQGALRETQRMACTIEQSPGRCALLEGNLEEGRARFYLGIAKVGDSTVRAICSMVGPVKPFPPVCNGVFAVP